MTVRIAVEPPLTDAEVADWWDDHEAACCTLCGALMEWESCWQCMGDGGFDLHEEDPLYYRPGQTERCSECRGEGGYLVCPMLPHKDAR